MICTHCWVQCKRKAGTAKRVVCTQEILYYPRNTAATGQGSGTPILQNLEIEPDTQEIIYYRYASQRHQGLYSQWLCDPWTFRTLLEWMSRHRPLEYTGLVQWTLPHGFQWRHPCSRSETTGSESIWRNGRWGPVYAQHPICFPSFVRQFADAHALRYVVFIVVFVSPHVLPR